MVIISEEGQFRAMACGKDTNVGAKETGKNGVRKIINRELLKNESRTMDAKDVFAK